MFQQPEKKAPSQKVSDSNKWNSWAKHINPSKYVCVCVCVCILLQLNSTQMCLDGSHEEL